MNSDKAMWTDHSREAIPRGRKWGRTCGRAWERSALGANTGNAGAGCEGTYGLSATGGG